MRGGQCFCVGGYRYGFQGQERDDEVKGAGNSVNYKYRMHDPRVGRFLSIDPLTLKYPHLTPYQFSSNSPLGMIEIEGLEGRMLASGKYVPTCSKYVKEEVAHIGIVKNQKIFSSTPRKSKGAIREIVEGALGGPPTIVTQRKINTQTTSFSEVKIEGERYLKTTREYETTIVEYATGWDEEEATITSITTTNIKDATYQKIVKGTMKDGISLSSKQDDFIGSDKTSPPQIDHKGYNGGEDLFKAARDIGNKYGLEQANLVLEDAATSKDFKLKAVKGLLNQFQNLYNANEEMTDKAPGW